MHTTSGRRAVFLDRDGVLNRTRIVAGKPYPPETLDAFELLPGVIQACMDLRAAGFPAATVVSSGAGFQIQVPEVLYTTPNPSSSISWPPVFSGYDPISGEPLISSGVSFKASYHLPDGTPVDPPVQMARLRTNEP